MSLIPILPELFVLGLACAVLLCGTCCQRTHPIIYVGVQVGLVSIFLILLNHMLHGPAQMHFMTSFVSNRFTCTVKLLMLGFTVMVFGASRCALCDAKVPYADYYTLGLLSLLGMMILVSAQGLIPLFLGLELFSLAIYTMIASFKGSASGIEAAVKYFVMGALATGILLYGISLLYGVTHHLEFHALASQSAGWTSQPLMLGCGVVFVLAGSAFKLGVAPFHAWIPDVYEGSPTPVVLWMTTVAKLAAWTLMVQLLIHTLSPVSYLWQPLVEALAIVSIAWGSWAALVQTQLKRLLGYSSIAHMGYVLLSFVCQSSQAVQISLFYMISYMCAAGGAFILLLLLQRPDGRPVEYIKDLEGLSNTHPWLAAMLMFCLFSMMGLPPFVGFIAKWQLLYNLLDNHHVVLSVIAILFSVVGAYYYLQILRSIYFSSQSSQLRCVPWFWEGYVGVTFTGIAVFVLGVFPQPLLQWCAYALP